MCPLEVCNFSFNLPDYIPGLAHKCSILGVLLAVQPTLPLESQKRKKPEILASLPSGSQVEAIHMQS
jgi:hypothetical protein